MLNITVKQREIKHMTTTLLIIITILLFGNYMITKKLNENYCKGTAADNKMQQLVMAELKKIEENTRGNK